MFAQTWEIRVQIFYAIFFALQLWALWRGAAPERCVAGVNIGMNVLDRIYHFIVGGVVLFSRFDPVHFAIDLLAFLAFTAIALRANRFYPICLAAIQLLAVTSHIVRVINPTIGWLAYGILTIAPSYLLIAVFGAAMAWHMLRRPPGDNTPSWLTSSGRSRVKLPGMSRADSSGGSAA